MDVNRHLRRRFGVHRGDTLPFKTRRCSRVTLAQAMAELGYKTGVEVGVQKGLYSEVLCKSIPGLKLKCVDPWAPYHVVSQRQQNLLFHYAKKRLIPYGVEFIRKTSMDAVRDVPDASLDFAYIDGMHEFDFVMMDIIEWSKKVRPGGIVAGHDYSNLYYQYGVVNAVNAYTLAHNISQWYITRDDEHPSYFWVRP